MVSGTSEHPVKFAPACLEIKDKKYSIRVVQFVFYDKL